MPKQKTRRDKKENTEKEQKSFWLDLAQHIELLIILFFIILNVFDMLEYMSPTFDYIDKISGIIGLAYLLYLVSPSRIILGQHLKKIDIALVSSYVLLMSDKFTSAAINAYQGIQEKAAELVQISYPSSLSSGSSPISELSVSVHNVNQLTSADLGSTFYEKILSLLHLGHDQIYFTVSDGMQSKTLVASTVSFPFSNFSLSNLSNYIDGSLFYVMKWIVLNEIFVEKFALYLGGILLLATAIYSAYKLEIKPASLLHVLHGDTKRFHKKHYRAIALFLVYSFFFLFIFQLMVEWLGVVIDAPILFIGILFYILLVVRSRRFFGAEHIINELGDTGEQLYHSFVDLFRSKHGLALGLAGILILHLLTDFGIYILTYLFYQHELTYFELGSAFFSQHHTPLFSILDIFTTQKVGLIFSDLALSTSLVDALQMIWVYVFNAVAIVFLFLAPAYIWWVLFKKKKAHEKEWLLVVCFISLATYVVFPLFHLDLIHVIGLVGTDITTSSVAETSGLLSLPDVVLFSVFIGGLVLALSLNHKIRRELVYLSFLLGLVFFALYVGYYYVDVLEYYSSVLLVEWQQMDLFVFFYVGVFALLSFVFYPVAFFVYVYELVKHYRLGKEE